MRLLNVKTFKLHSFVGDDTPSYAILSHRWVDSEVTFQDLQSEKGVEIAQANSKIAGCCRQAARNGYEYVWIDSCCIDKSSSAELSEAINSMFRWYQDALVCYVYLSDVPSDGKQLNPEGSFQNSAWFTRGWTLQELLAPEMAIFFDQAWSEIGTKATLENQLKSITGIKYLYNYSKACIAQKMSWAAHRHTTRTEDEAYCLMGIFGVNMPVLYGEGANAFLRLQQEIIKGSSDDSIFAWEEDNTHKNYGGMLAEHPSAFKNSGDVVQIPYIGQDIPPYSMTNRGLEIQLPLVPLGGSSNVTQFMAPLSCRLEGFDEGVCVAIQLLKWSQTGRTDTRKGIEFSYSYNENVPRSLIYVHGMVKTTRPAVYRFSIEVSQSIQNGFEICRIELDERSSIAVFCPLISLESWPLTTELTNGSYWLHFERHEDVFYLGIVIGGGTVGVQIWLPASLEDFPKNSRSRIFDRAQQKVLSGKVVSATLMKVSASKGDPDTNSYQIVLSMSD